MHELSIVMSIADAAEEQAMKHHAKAVESISLDIGNLAGIDEHALEFAWEIGVKNTVLEHAKYSINKIEGWARCSLCGCEFKITELFDPCPLCEGYLMTIVRGKEMKIHSITLLNE